MTKPLPPEKRLAKSICVRLTIGDMERLDQMVTKGGHRNRGELCRSIISAVLTDDAKAHEEVST